MRVQRASPYNVRDSRDTASSSLISYDKLHKHVTNKVESNSSWSAQGKKFKTFAKTDLLKIFIPQFTIRWNFSHTFHLFEKQKRSRYNAIIGSDVQQQIGLDLLNSKQPFSWMDIKVPLHLMGYWDKGLISNFWQAKAEQHEEFNVVKILNAKYEVPDLANVAQAQTRLSPK